MGDNSENGPASNAELGAAEALSVRISGVPGERPLSRNWRAEGADGQAAALVVLRDDVPQVERERFGAAAERLHKLGNVPGLLHVRSVSPSRDAYVADLWTTGTARDLGVFEWSARRRLEFVKAVAQALDALHKGGIAHGCLCEENILLSDDLTPVLAEAGSVSMHALVERGGDAASYAAFAAPEVIEGAEPGPRSDVYALGRLVQHVLRADDVPQVAALVRRCLAPSPAARYASAAEVVAAVEAVAGELPREAPLAAPASPVAARAPERKVEPPIVLETANAEPGPPTHWPPAAGGLMIVAAIAGAFLGAGSSPGIRYLLSGILIVGVALVAWTVRPQRQTPVLLRIVFALALAALVVGGNPLKYADRSSAARTIAHGSPEARRSAIAEIGQLGRDFRGMSLGGADLSGIDLRGADLRYADLSRADLSRANLSGAALTGTSLDGSQLSGTDLRQSDLGHALHMETATCNAKTLMPDPWRCADGHPSAAPAP